jgi:alpha,alpha-trehalose phosphorylase
VTGPDEYSAVADNNVYTNLLAQRNLRAAADAAVRNPDVATRLGVDAEETASWRDAAETIVIPYDDELGVHSQSEDFTAHDRWDFEDTAPDQYPLLLHFPYFDLYRKQVVKQADLVLAMFIRPDAFTDEQIARNFDYYEALTVRDSSLSANTQAVLAAKVGHLELAYDYFAEAALMDLDDLEHNTRDGLHIASLAGAFIAAIAGFGGVRDYRGRLTFTPRLPQALRRLVFRLNFRGRLLRIDVTHAQARYTLVRGEPLEIEHYAQKLRVDGRALTRRIPPAPNLPPPKQPPGREPVRRQPLR